MLTYEEVAAAARLNKTTAKRFVQYMRARWADTEKQKSGDGYAAEWAERFKDGDEYAASDRVGQSILDQMWLCRRMHRPFIPVKDRIYGL